MATQMTDRELAKIILDIFVRDYGCKPNECLMEGNLVAGFGKRGIRPTEIERGLKQAIKKGWVERVDDPKVVGKAVRITQKGYAVA